MVPSVRTGMRKTPGPVNHPRSAEENPERLAAIRTEPCLEVKTPTGWALVPSPGSMFTLESVQRGDRVKEHLWMPQAGQAKKRNLCLPRRQDSALRKLTL